MSELDIAALKPDDKVGWAFDRGWGGPKGVRESTVSRVTNAQIILADGMRFHRGGRYACREVGASTRHNPAELVSLNSPTAIKSRINDERQRVHDALEQLRKTKVELTSAALLAHIGELERVVKEARERVAATLMAGAA